MSEHAFVPEERAGIYRAMAERRGMRHFSGVEAAPELLARLLESAHQAPCVGLMQPWRFIRITRSELRTAIAELVEQERLLSAEALGERGSEFMLLKIEGIEDCAALPVVALMEGREACIFGRRTLPKMDLASAACAIQNLWLAARGEGLGLGWVSLFALLALAELLQIPMGATLVAVICLGPVDEFYPAPMPALEGWAQPRPFEVLLFSDRWGHHE